MRKNKVLTIWAAIVFAFLMIPLLIITVTAFGGGSAITFPIESFSTKWFANVFALKSFRRSFLTSLVVGRAPRDMHLPSGRNPGGLCAGEIRFKRKAVIKVHLPFPDHRSGNCNRLYYVPVPDPDTQDPGVRGTSRRPFYGDTSVCDPRSRFFDGAVRLFDRGGGVEPRMPEGSGVLQGRSSKCDLRNFLSIHAGVHQFLQ